MIKTLLILFLLCASSYAKEYTISQKKISLKVSFDISKEYEVKENFLNTPLLIWNKSLKHHGPSIGLFPMKNLPKHTLSKKAENSNLASFKRETQSKLLTLKATNISFQRGILTKEHLTYNYAYKLPGEIEILASEVLMTCSGRGIKIKSVVKKSDYKGFEPILSSFMKTLSCKKN